METVIWHVNGNTSEFLPSDSSTFGYLSNLVNNKLMMYFHVHDSIIYFGKSQDIINTRKASHLTYFSPLGYDDV